jgi:hypothetical protein
MNNRATHSRYSVQKQAENNPQATANISNGRVLSAMTFDELLEPFNPYIRRFGFNYVHFKNGGCLMSNEFILLIKDLWSGNKNEYDEKVGEWCVEHFC